MIKSQVALRRCHVYFYLACLWNNQRLSAPITSSWRFFLARFLVAPFAVRASQSRRLRIGNSSMFIECSSSFVRPYASVPATCIIMDIDHRTRMVAPALSFGIRIIRSLELERNDTVNELVCRRSNRSTAGKRCLVLTVLPTPSLPVKETLITGFTVAGFYKRYDLDPSALYYPVILCRDNESETY